jgi:hypothetical protein
MNPTRGTIAKGAKRIISAKCELSRPRKFENDRRRNELAIHCALNRIEESKNIQRLGLDLDRRHESA